MAMRGTTARAGSGLCTVLTLVALGLAAIGLMVQSTLRRTGQHATARVAALHASTWAAESALDEAALRLATTDEGFDLLSGAGRGRIAPTITRRVARGSTLTVGDVHVRPVGDCEETELHRKVGILELAVQVSSGTWRTGGAMRREVIRRYRLVLGSRRRSTAAQIYTLPVLLGQWVMP